MAHKYIHGDKEMITHRHLHYTALAIGLGCVGLLAYHISDNKMSGGETMIFVLICTFFILWGLDYE